MSDPRPDYDSDRVRNEGKKDSKSTALRMASAKAVGRALEAKKGKKPNFLGDMKSKADRLPQSEYSTLKK